MRRCLLLACILLALGPGAGSQTSPPQSAITVHVYKTGLFSGLAHNHTVRAPIASAVVDAGAMSVQIVVRARDLKVVDSEVSDSTRAEIQATMLGPAVLDSGKYAEIRFHSSRIEAKGPQHYTVTGTLDLHGISRTIAFAATGGPDRYTGHVKINQTDYGIKPVSSAGGTIKVKNELDLDFDISASEFAPRK
ncbi:MAG TPA: YceI family protein [Candidatus Saccharimonadales bacterium]|nr:YceI family protein [Candidatus Saccharimonadales bacterium]